MFNLFHSFLVLLGGPIYGDSSYLGNTNYRYNEMNLTMQLGQVKNLLKKNNFLSLNQTFNPCFQAALIVFIISAIILILFLLIVKTLY